MLYSFSKRIQNSWRFLTVVTLLAIILSLTMSYVSTPLYRAKATFLVFPNANLSSSRDVMTSLDTLDKRTITNTYALILSSYQVYKNTTSAIDLEANEAEEYTPRAEVQADANIINLYVEGPDPVVSAQLANNIGQNGIEYIKGIYQVYDISFLDVAIEDSGLRPFYPQPLSSMLIYGVSGFLVGIILVIFSSFIQAPIDALRQSMMKDNESGAFTRQHFVRLAEREITKDSEPISLVILDLVGLEGLIGRLPDLVQSEILTNITSSLRNQLRGNDIIGRWNENSFSILLQNTPGEPAARIMERLRAQLSERMLVKATGEFMELLPVMGVSSRVETDTIISLSLKAEKAVADAKTSSTKTVLFEGELEGED